MKQQIKEFYSIIKDYRKDIGLGISKERITISINQFRENDRVFILEELICIFKKRYFSKDRAKDFLKWVLKELKKHLSYSSYKELLDNSNFLDLQAKGKSQNDLLELFYEILKEDFEYDISKLGSQSKKHNIYIHDVLCTGNTFFNDLKDWVNEDGNNRLEDLRSKKIDLTVFYMAMTRKYYEKKRRQFFYNVSSDFRDLYNSFTGFWLEDELLKPIEENLSEFILEYQEKVEQQVNIYAKEQEYERYESDFYRNEINQETFYSSAENRERLELIFLNKGIEILNNSNVTKENVRPLGYSLPSYKDFGLGMLFFTWRNVPNNTPLVFSYKNSSFTPFFVTTR